MKSKLKAPLAANCDGTASLSLSIASIVASKEPTFYDLTRQQVEKNWLKLWFAPKKDSAENEARCRSGDTIQSSCCFFVSTNLLPVVCEAIW